ncbi:MAG: hypothetical protein KAT77_01215 [Nanoarchaeota archaeon]|nr:hypothetical protein [Nanoarchaeota archaeon]
MVDPATAAVLLPEAALPLLETIRTLVSTASYIVGGIFGIYLILLLVRWWQNRLIIRLLRDITYNLNQQNIKLKLPHAKPLFQSKIYKKLSSIFER